jgi:rubrerythrin
MNENRRAFMKNMALAGGCAFISLSPTKLFGQEEVKRIVPIKRDRDPSLNYQKTIMILQKAYAREIQAHLAYMKFSQKALEEDYPNIAYLFKSFAVAESIHGRNFENALVSFGDKPGTPEEKYKVLSTRKNLCQAIDLELQEINIYYPQHIRTIKKEEHWNAITSVAHALASEKQHESLLQKMKNLTGIFWGMLKRKIEGQEVEFFVCQVCGSTLTEIPDICPVCGKPKMFYEKIARHI